MPDISMCKGDDCPLRETCYRYKAEASERQSFFFNAPYNKEEKECDYYFPIEPIKNGKDNS